MEIFPTRILLATDGSEALVHQAACPVLVVRGGEGAWPPQRIVVGDDGSEAAWRAAELAGSIGGLFGAGVVLVRAQPIPPRPPELPDYEEEIYDRLLSEDRQRGTKELEERAAEVARELGTHPEVRLLRGDEAAAILATGEGDVSNLVAVGSRGLDPIRRARLGSVSTKVLRAARGPVLVCPPPLKMA